jgi:hypothetical protein
MFELYATGEYSLATLVEEGRRLGLRHQRGGFFSKNGMAKMLGNPFYYGVIRIQRSGQTFLGNHEPLISKELFDQVRELSNRRTKVATAVKRGYLFQRMIKCERCARGLYAETHKNIVYYRCQSKSCARTSVREDAVVRMIDAAVAQMNISDELLSAFRDMFKARTEDLAANAEERERNIRLAISQSIERAHRLTDAYLDRAIDREEYESRKSALINDRARLEEELRRLGDGGVSYKEREESFLELLKGLHSLVNLETAAEKRVTLKAAISNLSASEKCVAVTWHWPLQWMVSEPIVNYGGPYRDTSGTSVPRGHVLDALESSCEDGGRETLPESLMEEIVQFVLAREFDEEEQGEKAEV